MVSSRHLLAVAVAGGALLSAWAMPAKATLRPMPGPPEGLGLVLPAQITRPKTCQAEALMRAVTQTCINGRIRECRWHPNQAYPPCTFTHHCTVTRQRC